MTWFGFIICILPSRLRPSSTEVFHVYVWFMQDYIDSMEGATLSGRQCSARICEVGPALTELNKRLPTMDPKVADAALDFEPAPVGIEYTTV